MKMIPLVVLLFLMPIGGSCRHYYYNYPTHFYKRNMITNAMLFTKTMMHHPFINLRSISSSLSSMDDPVMQQRKGQEKRVRGFVLRDSTHGQRQRQRGKIMMKKMMRPKAHDEQQRVMMMTMPKRKTMVSIQPSSALLRGMVFPSSSLSSPSSFRSYLPPRHLHCYSSSSSSSSSPSPSKEHKNDDENKRNNKVADSSQYYHQSPLSSLPHNQRSDDKGGDGGDDDDDYDSEKHNLSVPKQQTQKTAHPSITTVYDLLEEFSSHQMNDEDDDMYLEAFSHRLTAHPNSVDPSSWLMEMDTGAGALDQPILPMLPNEECDEMGCRTMKVDDNNSDNNDEDVGDNHRDRHHTDDDYYSSSWDIVNGAATTPSTAAIATMGDYLENEEEEEEANAVGGVDIVKTAFNATTGAAGGGGGILMYEVLRIDSKEDMSFTQVEQRLSRRSLLRLSGLRPRDLRRVDPSLSLSTAGPDISVREEMMLINIGSVRAVVTNSSALIFKHPSFTCRRFLRLLRNRMKANYKYAMSSDSEERKLQVPFELVVGEAALISSSSPLEFDLIKAQPLMAKYVSRLKTKMTKAGVAQETLEEMRQFKQKLVTVESRAQAMSSMLLDLLDDEEDMQRLALSAHILTKDGGKGNKELLVEEWEMLLEYYLLRYETISSEAKRLLEEASDLEDTVSLTLSARRLELSKLELFLSICSLAVGTGAMIAGVFGMNLLNGFEVTPGVFWSVFVGIIVGGIGVAWGVISYVRRQGML
mmetsp:Transcript_22547/g.37673  ORF Transcript_22547/g.37673 Transcript_22547/m.37673 type:complete len:754 (-) Transcript_22547:228-2489(-)